MSRRTLVLWLVLAVIACSCSPRIVEKIRYQHDTLKVAVHDSTWLYQHDSVFVKEKGDTVYKYVEHIRYRDRFKTDTLVKVHEVHDTTTVEKLVEKQLTPMQRAKQNSFWWLVLALAGCALWIFRKPILKLIKL